MKRCTFRFAISTLVSGLILVSVAAIATVLYYGTRKALYQTTYEMMGGISHSMSDKLTQRLESVERLNALMAEMIHSGRLDPAKEESFTDFLKDAVAANPSITLIDCGLPSGHKYQALRMPDGSISRRLVHRGAHAVVSVWHHQNPAYAATERDSVSSLDQGYDPRTRPWWLAGLRAGKMAWTDIYASREGLNYSNVNPVYDARGNLRCILAIDMRVGDLSQFLSGLRVGRTGKAFIIDRDFRVVALSLAQGQDLGEIVKQVTANGETDYALRDLAELGDAKVRHAVLRYRKSPWMRGRGYLAFHDPDGVKILASFEPEPRYGFTFGVVVPEDDILGSIKRSLNLTLAMTALFLVLSLAAAFRISRSISRSLAELARQVDRVRLLDLSDGPPVQTSLLEVWLIGDSIQNMRKGLRSFKKYVPAEVVARLLHLQQEAVIEGEKRELTIFFSDIQDFTHLSERLSPEALVARLGIYFESVARILVDGSGTVDKFIGDAVMGFWGAPAPLADHAERACRAALQAQAAIQRLNQRWLAEGGSAFHTRMGIHTGEAIVGNVGYEGRMNYTAIGDSVNLASRLEGLNKFYGTRILISESTLRAAGGSLLTRTVDLVTVKGKEQAIAIHELLAMRAEASAEAIAAAERFDLAFEHYRRRRWEAALGILEELAGADGPARTLAERCRHCRAFPPDAGWDGVFRHHEK